MSKIGREDICGAAIFLFLVAVPAGLVACRPAESIVHSVDWLLAAFFVLALLGVLGGYLFGRYGRTRRCVAGAAAALSVAGPVCAAIYLGWFLTKDGMKPGWSAFVAAVFCAMLLLVSLGYFASGKVHSSDSFRAD